MKKLVCILCSALSVLMMMSCASTQNVDYRVARNYFHNNDAPLPASVKITTEEEFNRQFGMAAFMGKDGQPTPIDWQKNFVLAKVLPVTDVETTLTPLSLMKDGNDLVLRYSVKKGAKLGYSTQPMFVLLVSRKYVGLDVKEEN